MQAPGCKPARHLVYTRAVSGEASIEFEVEPNYDGWLLRDYVHE